MVKFNDLGRVNGMYSEEIAEAVARVVRSGWYLHGEETAAFEKEYADFIGEKECVACGNGLDALTMILRAMIQLGRLRPGDEVLVPANTFIATFLAITDNGLVPVPIEPDINTLQIDATQLEKHVTPRTRALMLVHLYGRCAFSDEIEVFLQNHPEISLLEDNAQAQGCRYKERRTGSLGLAAGHSFYPGKNLGALGDAGAVTTADSELAAVIRALGNYGSSSKYVCRYRGRNSRMDETNAAALRVKLRHLDEDNARRDEIAKIYRREICNPSVSIPGAGDRGSNVHHLFPIFSAERDKLQAHLASQSVETIVHYPIPPHLQECYRDEAWARHTLPVTEQLAATELSLPIHAAMTAEEAHRVADAVNSWKPY